MLESIAGVDRGGVFQHLVLEADQKSVERDLKANHIPVDASLGVPVEKYLLDAMRRLIGQGQWTANSRGSRVWHFKDGLHVVWKAGAQEITELLARDRIPGIPRDPDTLADILIERGLAIPRQDDEGRTYRYWRMALSGMDVALYMLRLSSPELVYNGEPPLVIEGRWVDGEDQDVGLSKGEKPEIASDTESSGEQSDKQGLENNPSQQSNSVKSESKPRGNAHESSLLENPAESPNADLTKPTPSDVKSGKPTNENAQPLSVAEIEKAKSKPDNQPVAPSVATGHPVQPTSPSEPDDNHMHAAKLEAKHWLFKQGEAGEWLRTAMIANSDSTSAMANVVDGQVFLSHPDMALKLGKDPSESLQLLDRAGWIETDLRTPMRKVREVGGVRGIMLNKEASRCWLALTSEVDLQAIQAKPKPTLNASVPKISGETPSAPKEKTKPRTDAGSSGNADKPGTLATGKPPSKPIALDNPLSTKEVDGAKSGVPAKPNPAFKLERPHQDQNIEQPKLASKSEAAPALKPSPPSPVDRESETDAVDSLIRQVREGGDLPCSVTEDEGWLSVPYAILDWHVEKTPGLTRSKLIVSLHRHPDVQLEGNRALKIRKLSD